MLLRTLALLAATLVEASSSNTLLCADSDAFGGKGDLEVCSGATNSTWCSLRGNLVVPDVSGARALRLVLNETRGVAGTYVALYVYAPWCPFSARHSPKFHLLARAFPYRRIQFATVDGNRYRRFSTHLMVRGFPSFQIFSGGKAVATYGGDWGLDDVVRFVRDVTDAEPHCVAPWMLAPPGPVRHGAKWGLTLAVAYTAASILLSRRAVEACVWRRAEGGEGGDDGDLGDDAGDSSPADAVDALNDENSALGDENSAVNSQLDLGDDAKRPPEM